MSTVLVTGASGGLGRKLRRHLAAAGHSLRLLDVASDDPEIVEADLSAWDAAWTEQFKNVDAVVHLAGASKPSSTWQQVQRLNIDLTMNVFEAAVRGGVRRIVFASSNWVMAGYRFDGVKLTTDMAPRPINAYGTSKLFGERLARSYHERFGLEAVCFRIGYIQPDENLPGPHMRDGSWGQLMWLSDRDFLQAMDAALAAPRTGFAVLNLMSDNPGMPWDISATKSAIGYAPRDGHAAELDDGMAARQQSAEVARKLMGELERTEMLLRW